MSRMIYILLDFKFLPGKIMLLLISEMKEASGAFNLCSSEDFLEEDLNTEGPWHWKHVQLAWWGSWEAGQSEL